MNQIMMDPAFNPMMRGMGGMMGGMNPMMGKRYLEKH